MAKKKNDIFWASYADLMTALFVMMLALFVLSYKLFTDKNSELEVMAEQYQKIKEIEAALGALEGEYFRFDPENKRHELIIPIEFQSSQAVILPRYREQLYEAGKILKNTIKNIETDQSVRYVVIIEGMAARYTLPDRIWRNNDPAEMQFAYQLSYQRALALYRFWESRGITFDKNTFEVIIAGSGFQGAGRYNGKEEPKNKRFLIQIIPKVGKISGLQSET
jgi:outer membrane protein OmpA-like peptidoglycan-associated protein